MVRLILILTLISNIAFAQNAQFLNQGDKAPFSGDLLTLDQTKSLYNDSLEKSSLQKQLDLTNQNNTLLEQEKTILLDQNNKLINAAQSEKTISTIEKGAWFLVGILVTALAVKGASSLHQ